MFSFTGLNPAESLKKHDQTGEFNKNMASVLHFYSTSNLL